MLNQAQKQFINNALNHLNIGKLGATFGANGCVYHDKSIDAYCVLGCNIPKEYFTREFYELHNEGTDVRDLLEAIPDLQLPFNKFELAFLQRMHDGWVDVGGYSNSVATQFFKESLEKILSGKLDSIMLA